METKISQPQSSLNLKNSQYKGLLQNALIFAIALGIALAIFLVLILVMGKNVPIAFRTLLLTTFGSEYAFVQTCLKAVTLVFTTYAFTIPFRVQLYNIGGNGQMIIGAVAASLVGLNFTGTDAPRFLVVLLMLIAAFIAGGAYASIAAILKVKYDINTVISTMMLNFIAMQVVNYVASAEPWADPYAGHPTTVNFPDSAILPIFGGVFPNVLFAAGMVIFVILLMRHSIKGYEIMAMGYNQNTAETYGVNYVRTAIFTFLIAGGAAGLGGSLELMTIRHHLIDGFHLTSGAEFGTFGMLTCLICAGNEKFVPLTAFFVSIMLVGADALQRTLMIPSEIVFLVISMLVIVIVATRSFAKKKGFLR